jgi:hypothetical protein
MRHTYPALMISALGRDDDLGRGSSGPELNVFSLEPEPVVRRRSASQLWLRDDMRNVVVPTYDRRLMLFGAKRDEVLRLWEVRRYGRDSYGDPDYLRLYGMTPAQWYARGVRLRGRTAVECTRDTLADLVGRDIAALVPAAFRVALVVDPFAGSANTLYWIARHLPGARPLGFETDPGVYALTSRNRPSSTYQSPW